MTHKTHHYHTRTEWTGNLGSGTSSYTAYSRNHIHRAPGKPDIPGSADPATVATPPAGTPKNYCSPPPPPATNSGTCTTAPTTASPSSPTATTPKPK